jgi:hypothetical protein
MMLMGLLGASVLHAAEMDVVHGVPLERTGSGVLKLKRLISVYDATLYLPSAVASADAQ